jgi:DNA-binding MarR family transcriptional regulator/N-acetylglutamate synthase-like GNAT family acetyltransferase
MIMSATPDCASRVRQFNRFYTRRIGLLNQRFLKSRRSLAEMRVLYELAHADGPATASALIARLGLDRGYLSRILRRLEVEGLIARRQDLDDRRLNLLWLTEEGRREFAALDAQSQAEAAAMVEPLAPAEQERLVAAMATIEELLSGARAAQIILRPHRPGDMGWITYRHAVLYHEAHGWNADFEVLAGKVTTRFLENFDPDRERAWIADRNGAIIGAVMLVKESDETARLRVLYVEPAARGLGLGRRLVEECVAFARRCGYRRIVLSTYDILVEARQLYASIGFRLVEQRAECSYGQQELALQEEGRLSPQ